MYYFCQMSQSRWGWGESKQTVTAAQEPVYTLHPPVHATSDPLLLVEQNQRVGVLSSWAMGRGSQGSYSLLLHMCEILTGGQRGGREEGVEAERKERREEGGEPRETARFLPGRQPLAAPLRTESRRSRLLAHAPDGQSGLIPPKQ